MGVTDPTPCLTCGGDMGSGGCCTTCAPLNPQRCRGKTCRKRMDLERDGAQWLWVCGACGRRDQARIRHAESGYACPDCRARLAGIPGDVADAYAWLGWALLRPESGKTGDGRAASPDPALPFPIDAHDLLAPGVLAQGPLALARLAENADLQQGQPPVAAVLTTWIRDWIDRRGQRENGPSNNVAAMAVWLRARTDWACEHHPAVDEYAGQMRSLLAALHGVVGQPKPDDRPIAIPGVPCPRCRFVALSKFFDPDRKTWMIQCGWEDCNTRWTETEYAEKSKAMAAAARRGQIARQETGL